MELCARSASPRLSCWREKRRGGWQTAVSYTHLPRRSYSLFRFLSFHGISGQKGAMYGKMLFVLLWDRRGNLREQMRIGFLPAFQILHSSIFIGIAFLTLPGNFFSIPLLRGIYIDIPGDIPGNRYALFRFPVIFRIFPNTACLLYTSRCV